MPIYSPVGTPSSEGHKNVTVVNISVSAPVNRSRSHLNTVPVDDATSAVPCVLREAAAFETDPEICDADPQSQ